MSAFLAAASTLASTPYSALSLVSICSSGWLPGSRSTSVSIIFCSAFTGVGVLFQNTWPAASMRRLIGSGGSFGFSGGFSVFCGRSTSTGTDWIGMVTMKLISSTSITSTRGVTLMSHIAPLPPVEKAMGFSLLAALGRSGDEADLGHALLLGDLHDLADLAVGRGLVA